MGNRIKYRPHRGSLEESMRGWMEFKSIESMKRFIAGTYKNEYWMMPEPPFTIDDIVIGEVIGDDDRIGWKNVRHIGIKRWGNEDYIAKYGCPQCIAWCGE